MTTPKTIVRQPRKLQPPKFTRTRTGVIIEGAVNPFLFSKVLRRRADKRNSRSPSDIRDRMRSDLAERKRDLDRSIQRSPSRQYSPPAGGWTLDIQ